MGVSITGITLPDMRFRSSLVLLALLLLVPARPAAHEIPADVLAHAMIRPDGGRMQIIVRVPLATMRDVDWPLAGAGFLQFDRLGTMVEDAATTWIANEMAIYENGERLPAPRVAIARVTLPLDRSIETWDQAMAHLRAPPLPDDTQLIWNQALLDVLLETPIGSAASEFSIDPAFVRLGIRVTTALRFLLPDGTVRGFQYSGNPGTVRLDPQWHQAALQFAHLGFAHILGGIDHLLFLLCLVIPFRQLRSLVLIVTSFTVAHSITMIASALGHAPDQLWFPPLVETLIAASILYMAIENIAGAGSVGRRWVITFAFGLVHGFGFSFALRESLQFSGSHLAASLVAFNLGVEVGQVLVLLALVPALGLLFRHVIAERMGAIVLCALVAHTGWHWMIERGSTLRGYDWTVGNPWLLLVRALMVGVALAGVWWAARTWRGFGTSQNPVDNPVEAGASAPAGTEKGRG
jgi:hypothetical protein